MIKSVKRLFEQFHPESYNLNLIPDKKKMTFSGTVVIKGRKTGRPSSRITLHQKYLKITSATVTKHDKKGDHKILVDRINNHKSFDEVRLHAKEILYPSNYTITLEFSGKITKPMNGVYPCFFELKGKDEKLIATQFESHHAREVFPCIDEPEAKATFDLTLTTPAGETVVSNTEVKSQVTKGKMQETTFEATPIMSTYLLAFVYGKLEHLSAKTKSGVEVKTYATPDNVKLTEFTLEVAVKCLDYYQDYFGIDYPLKKCDLIALPDFASGAMENWGCITFREQTMLVDPKNSTLATKQYVAMVVAHELAHMWFGNLVTMRWWTDLWLNEGFASWVEYLAIDHIFPDWGMWTQFAVDEQHQALRLDALENTHPIEVKVNHPEEIRTIFDAISYSKGASVIHMLHEYLGPDVFKDGLRHYLKKHAYRNTDTVDLWESLEEVSKLPVKKFMETWTTKPGFPLLQTIVDGGSVTVSQSRFMINPKSKLHDKTVWPVALLAKNPNVPDLLNQKASEFEIADAKALKLNQGQSGFYRTIYNVTHLANLGEQIARGKLDPVERLGILSDSFESAKAGMSSTVDSLKFLTNFSGEDNYAVWDVIASSLGSIKLVMGDDDLREQIKPYIRKLVSGELKRIGWDKQPSESHFDSLLRPIILGLASSADEPAVVAKCLDYFEKYHDMKNLDPDLKGTIFGTAARLGGKKEFDKLLKLHNASTLSEERTTLAAAITGFKQPELIGRALSQIDSADVRLQDVAYWIAYSFMNRHAKEITWDWLKSHWKWLEENLGTDLSFSRMPIYAARVFSDESFIKKYKTFFEPHMTKTIERSYKQGLEMLEWQTEWKKRDFKEVKTFFENQ